MGFNFKSKSPKPVRGGSGKMYGPGGTAMPDANATAKKSKPGKSGKPFVYGGKGKMYGKGSAKSTPMC